MTDSPIAEILKAGEFALEYTHGRRDELTVEEIVDVVGRAVLHAAAEKIRSYGDPADHWAANLIDPQRACDCGERSCPCGCQEGEREPHWIHSRTCNTQKRQP